MDLSFQFLPVIVDTLLFIIIFAQMKIIKSIREGFDIAHERLKIADERIDIVSERISVNGDIVRMQFQDIREEILILKTKQGDNHVSH
jgi:hypothetical protein